MISWFDDGCSCSISGWRYSKNNSNIPAKITSDSQPPTISNNNQPPLRRNIQQHWPTSNKDRLHLHFWRIECLRIATLGYPTNSAVGWHLRAGFPHGFSMIEDGWSRLVMIYDWKSSTIVNVVFVNWKCEQKWTTTITNHWTVWFGFIELRTTKEKYI